MYERSRSRNPHARGLGRPGRFRRSRERSPIRLRSPVRSPMRSPVIRERSRPRFERNRSRERFRRSRERSPRIERFRSAERFEPPYQLEQEPRRFEPPAHEIVSRTFENERYRPPSPRFEDRVDIEPLAVERNLNFDCPADYDKFQATSERHYSGVSAEAVGANPRLNQSNIREESPPFITNDKEDAGDKNDPWVSNSGSQEAAPSSSSQLQPTFGKEKGSNLIPEFDPDTSDININTFLKLIDKVGQEKGWSGNERKFQFSMKLRGPAKDWFLNDNKFIESWSTIRKQFKANFPADMDYHSTLTNMLQRVKRADEDLSTYFNYKIILLKNCGIVGRKAVSCLIGGLPESMQEVRTNAWDKNFATAEDLYKFLIDQNIDAPNTENTNPKCNLCGKKGCNCHKIENKPSMAEEDSSRTKIKCYKYVYITGKKMKCLLDENFPYNTVRESDIDFLKLRYRRQITIISGHDIRTSFTSLGISQILIRVDDLFTEMPFHVIKDNLQETPVVLGKAAIKYPHITTKNGIFFTADVKRAEFTDPVIEIRNSRSPPRRIPHDHELAVRRSPERRSNRSPPRRSSPGRLYKDSSLFINQFYGNPYA